MAEVVLALLVTLWLIGFIQIPWLNIPHQVLLIFNDQPITIRDFLIFILTIWIVSILPKPLRIIAGIMFILWILSIIGIVTISGLSNLLILAIIVGLILHIFGLTH
jgi:hypothetical protein